MALDTSVVHVVDVEATCWATREEQGSQPNEVIEIGHVKLDARTGRVLDAAQILVVPRTTRVSAFCHELTGHTQANLEANGVSIERAMEILASWSGMDRRSVWFSCGEYDRVKLDAGNPRHLGSLGHLYGLPASASPYATAKHVNVKTLFALRHRLKREEGMERMLQRIGAPLEGRHHSGLDDARNIAKIVRHVLGWPEPR